MSRVGNLPMRVFLTAVRDHRTRAREALIDLDYPPKMVYMKAVKAADRGWTEYGVVADRPWLTPPGVAWLEHQQQVGTVTLARKRLYAPKRVRSYTDEIEVQPGTYPLLRGSDGLLCWRMTGRRVTVAIEFEAIPLPDVEGLFTMRTTFGRVPEPEQIDSALYTPQQIRDLGELAWLASQGITVDLWDADRTLTITSEGGNTDGT